MSPDYNAGMVTLHHRRTLTLAFRRIVPHALLLVCLSRAALAQIGPPDLQALLPTAAVVKQQLSLAIGASTAEVAVYEIADDPKHMRYTRGIRILKYSLGPGWSVEFEETHPGTELEHKLSVEKLKAASGKEALLVSYLASGAGTATFWHVLAPINGDIVELDSRPERAKVLDPRGYVDKGYNSVKADGDRILEKVPGYTQNQARCCPNRPSLEMSFRFTGESIEADSVKEGPYGPPALALHGTLLRLNENGLGAYGYQLDDGFLVVQFSESPKNHAPSTPGAIVALRNSLVDQGVLADNGVSLTLTQNYEFTSSSVSASVMLARPADGATEWKDENGRPAGTLPTPTTP